MKIIEPSVEFMGYNPDMYARALKVIEECGRVCYKSEDKIKEGSAEKFIKGIIDRGHEAVIEHFAFTMIFVCDRGVSHEIVRHRIASYCQESTRYCNYSMDKFNNEITVINPFFFVGNDALYNAWRSACENAEEMYFDLLNRGATPQEARTVLPNSLKTEVCITMNIREWRHFFELRCSERAHPQMRQVALMALNYCYIVMPIFFEDLADKYGKDFGYGR